MKYKLQDLIDIQHFQNLQDRLNEIYSFPSSIIDNDGNILTATAWQDICTKFHRKNKECEKDCIQSDQYILGHLHEANPAVSYRCPHGLVDNATPIIIDGVHYGNFFTGQFFMEAPDLDFFKRQAKKYGFDEDAYLAAVKKVPIWSQDQLNSYLFFIKGLIAIISESGLKNLKEVESRKKIQESEERLRLTTDNLPDSFVYQYTHNDQGKPQILFISNSVEKALPGIKQEDLLKDASVILNLIEPKQISIFQEAVETSARLMTNFTLDLQARLTGGELRWFHLHSRPRRDETGRVIWDGAAVDFTDRRRAEEALHHSHALMKYVIEHNRSAVSVHDRDLKFLYVSRRYLDEVKVMEKDVIGRHHYDVFPNMPQKWKDAHQKALAGEISSAEDDPYVGEDGTVEWARWECRPWYEADGSIGGIIIYTEIITDRKQAELALKGSEQYYRKLFDQANEGLFIMSTDGKLVEVNQAFADMHGYTIDELRRMDITELDVLRETTLTDRAEIIERMHAGEVVRFDAEHFHKDGRTICLNVTTSLIQLGDKPCYLGFHQDITERKQMEARLLEAQKIESIGTLAGGIAHDFNNLLFPIMGMAEMLLEDLPKGSVEHENAEEIFKASQRAGDLVKQILSFSRQSNQRKMPVRIQHILKEVLKLTRATIPSNIEMQSEIQSDCGFVMADPTQIHQVAMNLITNAYHAVEKKGGTIMVSLEGANLVSDDIVREPLQSREQAILTVSDNGCGIDPSTMMKIFEPYFTTKPRGKGTGLGLSVVYGIVKDHGGEIQVKSEPGKGASFIVYLPLMARTQEAFMTEATVVPETGDERILLVDDEESIVRLEAQMLKKLGYEVIARTSSVDALAAFRADPDHFDLVITDMAMPNMTGDRFAAELLSIKPGIPIIICTGFSEKLSEEMAESIGIKGFLMKPVIKSDMAKTVRKVLNSNKTNS